MNDIEHDYLLAELHQARAENAELRKLVKEAFFAGCTYEYSQVDLEEPEGMCWELWSAQHPVLKEEK